MCGLPSESLYPYIQFSYEEIINKLISKLLGDTRLYVEALRVLAGVIASRNKYSKTTVEVAKEILRTLDEATTPHLNWKTLIH